MKLLCSLAVPTVGIAGPIPVEPPAPPWKDFVKTDGHANEIPVGWIGTEPGRFAHSIVLPDSVPKTVPFDFTAARWRALSPNGESVARQYWEHLCSTEAGSFILRPADNVDGFFFMRPVGGANEQQNNDRWKLEAPGMQASWGWKYDPAREAEQFVDPPSYTYEWVDFPAPDGGILHMFGYVSRASPMKVERQSASSAKYGLTWRGIRRERDREYAISGVEWIALEIDTREVLGVIRDFDITGMTTNRREGIYWINAARCPFKRQMFGGAGELRETDVWVPTVLRPSLYPKALKVIHDRVRTTK
ncbi:MAG TPA: hypothetical protein VMG60_01085 [Burkholderiaceae bacterium]|nr:hypothetical protein [Burkholderiaceae bacterium]